METQELRKVIKNLTWKKFRRYDSGAEYYEMSQSKFEQLAKDANATYKIDKVVLVNCNILERYLESFRIM